MALLVMTTLTGCGPKDTVHLQYSSATPVVMPSPTAPRMAVVLFEDKRPMRDSVGLKRDGSKFTPDSLVTEWVSRGLADELSRMGPQISYTPTIQLAQPANPDFIVTGSVDEVWIREVGVTTFNATIKVTVNLANRNGNIMSQTLASTQERRGVPTSGSVENLMMDTLREVMGVAASKISEASR